MYFFTYIGKFFKNMKIFYLCRDFARRRRKKKGVFLGFLAKNLGFWPILGHLAKILTFDNKGGILARNSTDGELLFVRFVQ